MGVGIVVPAHDARLIKFIDEVDRRLYRAKRVGRDRIGAHG